MTVPGRWRKSSRSGQDTSCVEVEGNLDRVRDSKNPGGPILRTSVPALVRAIKAGRLGR